MVFKVCKGGVRSGNTLRGLYTRRTRLYRRHACMIGRSNLGSRKLDTFLSKTSDEDSLVGDTLKNTDVLLSLNKKQRWRVPAVINQMIAGGRFDKSSMVSLLERHKLKRKANCVRFASNGGRLTRIQPKQKKYFSMSLDGIDEDHSNRQRRKLMLEEFKKLKTSEDDRKGPVKILNVFTFEGKARKGYLEFESKKEEYRMEVLYPCPQSCSLTFNPKYTDVVLEEGKSGSLEVKANLKAPKKGKRHRKHLMAKDIDDFDEEALGQDVSDMWDECYVEADGEETSSLTYSSRAERDQSDAHYLDALLNQAIKAQKLVACRKQQNNKGHNRRLNISDNVNTHKSRVKYVTSSAANVDDKTTKKIESSHLQNLEDVRPLEFAKVILQSNETTEAYLEEKFGNRYSEAGCQPRRFTINVTEDVANVMSTSKTSIIGLSFISYLVFIYDGIYDNGLDVYRVIFNSYSCKNTCNLSDYLSFSQMSFDDVMNSAIGCFLEVKDREENKINDSNSYKHFNNFYKILHKSINLKCESFNPSNALLQIISSKNVQKENAVEFDKLSNCYLSLAFDQDVFCDICYDTINPTKIDAVYGTQLSRCGHHCCDTCWASHFQSQMRGGSTSITCPGYDCSTDIGLSTLLSMVHVSAIALLFQRRAEEEVETAENAKWCPNESCGLVIKIDSARHNPCQDVTCACGTPVCFACLGPAHWPARCDQAEEYWDKLATMKPPKETVEEPDFKPNPSEEEKKKQRVVEVEGRICPLCKRFINKNGGCSHMLCKCGFAFCWNCLQPFHGGYYHCNPDETFVRGHSRLLRVHHRQAPKLKMLSKKPTCINGHFSKKSNMTAL